MTSVLRDDLVLRKAYICPVSDVTSDDDDDKRHIYGWREGGGRRGAIMSMFSLWRERKYLEKVSKFTASIERVSAPRARLTSYSHLPNS